MIALYLHMERKPDIHFFRCHWSLFWLHYLCISRWILGQKLVLETKCCYDSLRENLVLPKRAPEKSAQCNLEAIPLEWMESDGVTSIWNKYPIFYSISTSIFIKYGSLQLFFANKLRVPPQEFARGHLLTKRHLACYV
jgi:hypothetical protein